MIRPAVEGTRRAIEGAAAAGVRRFVLTSPVVAMMYGHPCGKTRFDESDWSDPQVTDATPYSRSKVLAERAARAILPCLGREYHVDASTTHRVLGLDFIPPIEAVLASVQSLVTKGRCRRRERGRPDRCLPRMRKQDMKG